MSFLVTNLSKLINESQVVVVNHQSATTQMAVDVWGNLVSSALATPFFCVVGLGDRDRGGAFRVKQPSLL